MDRSQSQLNFGQTTFNGAVWQYVTFFSGKVMVLISTAILARYLSQDDFGVVAYALTAIAFVDVISDLGVGSALIYYPEDERTTSTAFWLNLLIGAIVFGITWLLAPLIGAYFRDMRAVTALQIMGLVYPLRAIGDTHDALLSKRLQFSRLFIPELLQGLVKGSASIAFALLGFGASSLIWGYISGTFVSSLAYWFITPWHPEFIFDWQTVRSLIKYGLKIVSVNIVAIFLVNLDYLLVGRYLGAEALGIYSLAFRLPDLVVLQFARVLSNVLFPVYSQIRSVQDSLKNGFLLTLRYLTLVTVPLGCGLALVAYPITTAFFSEKWLPAAPVIQGLAMYALFSTLAYPAGSIYKAEGRPQILTWLGLLKLIILFPSLWWAVTISKSIAAVGFIQAGTALISAILSLYLATRLINVRASEVLKSFASSILAGAVMSIGVTYTLIFIDGSNPWVQLLICIFVGGFIYIGFLFVIEKKVMLDIWNRFKKMLTRS